MAHPTTLELSGRERDLVLSTHRFLICLTRYDQMAIVCTIVSWLSISGQTVIIDSLRSRNDPTPLQYAAVAALLSQNNSPCQAPDRMEVCANQERASGNLKSTTRDNGIALQRINSAIGIFSRPAGCTMMLPQCLILL